MSAIGDYVHYSRSNYLESGLSHKNKGTYEPYNFEEWINKYKEKITNTNSKYKLDKIEENLNYIFSTNNNSRMIGKQSIGELHQEVEEKMQEAFEEDNAILDWATGKITSNDKVVTAEKISKDQKIILSNLKAVKNNDARFIQSIKQRINALMNIKIENQEKQDTLQSKIEKLKEQYFDVLEIIDQQCKDEYSWASKASGTFFRYFKEKGLSNKSEKLSSLVGDLNKVLSFTRNLFNNGNIANQSGKVLEYVNTGLKGLIIDKVDEDMDAVIDKVFLTGDKTERVTIDRKKIGRNIDINTIGWSYEDDTKQKIYVSTSQQKIDAVFEMNDGYEIKISDKNINLKRGGISLVKEAPLLNLLISQNGDFVNHYLNLVSSHSRGRNSNDINNQLQTARQAVKITVFWQALVGGDERKQANVFILNDNSNSNNDSVKVINMSDLAEKAMSDFDQYIKITTNTGATIDNLKFENKWSQESAWNRISLLLAEVHAVKIKVALRAATIS